jgi:hypothetical protein
VDERAEPDSLDDPGDAETTARECGGCHGLIVRTDRRSEQGRMTRCRGSMVPVLVGRMVDGRFPSLESATHDEASDGFRVFGS